MANVFAVCHHQNHPAIFDQAGSVYMYDEKEGKEILRHQFESPLSAHYDMDYHDDEPVIICGLQNCTITLVGGFNEKYKPIEQFEAKLPDGRPRYGSASVVYGKTYVGYEEKMSRLLVVACTDSHLLLLAPRFFSYSRYDETSSDEGDTICSKEETKDRPQKSPSMKLIFRVKKCYKMVEITASFQLLIAAYEGKLDLFQVSHLNNEMLNRWQYSVL